MQNQQYMDSGQMNLPKMLKYKSIKPKGMPSRMRRVEVNQMNNQQSFSFNDIIRFQFQTDSYIDPYQTYIELQVEVPQNFDENMPKVSTYKRNTNTFNTGVPDGQTEQKFADFQNVPLYILDGPATSFISEMIMYSNGREIERVQEYDQLGNLIADLGIDKFTRHKSGYYGLASSFGKSDYSYFNHQINSRSNQNDKGDGFLITKYFNDSNSEFISYAMNNNQKHQHSTTTGAYQFLSNFILDETDTTQSSNQITYVKNQITQNPIPDYLDYAQVMTTRGPLVQQSQEFNFNAQSNLNIATMLSAQQQISQYSMHGNQLRSYYNNHPGLYETTVGNNYYDILNGKKSDTANISLLQADPKSYINYAREFALQDGQFGIEHYNTISITPYVNTLGHNTNPDLFDEATNPNASLEPQAQLAWNKSAFNHGQSALLNPDEENYQANQTIKRRKKILYNAASNNNNFTYFAPGIAQARWKNGMPVTDFNIGGSNITENAGKAVCAKEQKYAMTKKTFYIPLLSGIIGHLIPCEQWKLIPGKGCGVMNWEFRLNRHAIFMSGHKMSRNDANTQDESLIYDFLNLANSSSQFHSGRQGWKINKISMHFDLWDFPDSVNQIVEQQLQEGIVMNSQAFVSGPTYSIQNTNSLRGSWQINNSIQSLKKLYFWFLLDDYQAYNYCSKNFRISHNLKSIQLKLGQEFVPEQPITGHAGNLFEFNNETTKDFMPFYLELLRTQGEMFSKEGRIQILPQQFIVNDRAYDPSDVYQTQFQTAFLHETRLRGKAVYTVDMEADPYDFDTISGKNIAEVKPVEIMIDVHTAGAQTRPSTMFTLLHADSLVQFSKDGIQVAV